MATFCSLGKPLVLALVWLLAVALGLARVATAQASGPGDLDTSFGRNGIVTTTIEGFLAAGSAIAVQPDGKIVVAGRALDGTKRHLVVVRYLSDGSPDPSFGMTGIVTTPVKAGVFDHTLIIQPDGKIVAASPDLLVRLLSNGHLDPDFGDAGKVILPISVHTLARQADGKIVAAGDVIGIGGYSDLALARFNHDGSPDNAFNKSGVVTTPLFFVDYDGASGVAIDPYGRIVVSIVGGTKSLGSMKVARYNPTGDLDQTFNNTGIVFTPIGSQYYDDAAAVAISPQRKIVLVGEADISLSGTQLALVRYNETGSLDTTFNKTGVVTTMIGPVAVGRDVAFQRYGKILVAGTSNSRNFPQFTLLRYTEEGALDTSFNGTGIVITPIDDVPGECYALAMQADGKIVVTGFTYNFDITVARYLGDPQLSLAQTVDDQTPEPGQRVTYTLVISNASDTDATGAVISDTLPAGLTLAGGAALEPEQAGVKLAQFSADLPYVAQGVMIEAGQIVTVTVPVTVIAKAGTLLSNTAAVTSVEVITPETDTISLTVASGPRSDIYLPLLLKE